MSEAPFTFTLHPNNNIGASKRTLTVALFELQVHKSPSPELDEAIVFLKQVSQASQPEANTNLWLAGIQLLANKLGEDIELVRDTSYWRNWTKEKIDLLEEIRKNPYRQDSKRAAAWHFLAIWYELTATKSRE